MITYVAQPIHCKRNGASVTLIFGEDGITGEVKLHDVVSSSDEVPDAIKLPPRPCTAKEINKAQKLKLKNELPCTYKVDM